MFMGRWKNNHALASADLAWPLQGLRSESFLPGIRRGQGPVHLSWLFNLLPWHLRPRLLFPTIQSRPPKRNRWEGWCLFLKVKDGLLLQKAFINGFSVDVKNQLAGSPFKNSHPQTVRSHGNGPSSVRRQKVQHDKLLSQWLSVPKGQKLYSQHWLKVLRKKDSPNKAFLKRRVLKSKQNSRIILELRLASSRPERLQETNLNNRVEGLRSERKNKSAAAFSSNLMLMVVSGTSNPFFDGKDRPSGRAPPLMEDFEVSTLPGKEKETYINS